MSEADLPSTAALAGSGAASNAAAITDLLGDPSVQTDPHVKDQRRGQWVWLVLIIFMSVVAVFLFPRLTSLFAFTQGDNSVDLTALPTHLVERRDLDITVTAEGSLVSDDNIDVTCEVKGGATIIWLVDDGAQVKKGMEIVRLDAFMVNEYMMAQQIDYERARALMIQAEKDFAAAKIAVEEYRDGIYKKDERTAESNVTAAEERLQATKNTLAYGERMFRKGYITPQQLEAQKSAVARAELDLGTAQIALDVLNRFTKPKMLTELESIRDATEARLESEKAALKLEKLKLDRYVTQVENCTIKAPQDGIAIYYNTRSRDQTTEIKPGTIVKERQVILQLPDLTKMRADVEVHESKVDEIKIGMPATVRVQGERFKGEVIAVANRPESNWYSPIKKYVVEVRIDGQSDALRPGFTAEAEVMVADLQNVIAVPVAAVLEQDGEYFCAVRDTEKSVKRHAVTVGLTDDNYVQILDGLKQGESVFLNPRQVLGDRQTVTQNDQEVEFSRDKQSQS